MSDLLEVDSVDDISSGKLQIADILIIEDDVDELTYLNEILTQAGYRVRPARSGGGGLRAAHRIRPNIILLDIQLPDMDGFEVCRRIKSDSRLRNIPIIFVTGSSDIESHVQAFEAGGRDYITKPFKEVVVLTRIKNQLQIEQLQHDQKAYTLLQERHRIARDLHDSVSQTLFTLGAVANSLMLTQNDLPTNLNKDLAYIHKLSQIALKEMRLQLFELQYKELLHIPIEVLVQEIVELLQTRIEVNFSVNIDDVSAHLENDPVLKVAVYRIMREAIYNAIKHAKATHIKINITRSGNYDTLVIEDDGIGFDEQIDRKTGSGISNMYERAIKAGIELTIDTKPHYGTKIQLIWEKKGGHE